MDTSALALYEKDIYERQAGILLVKHLHSRKLEALSVFQKRADLWKTAGIAIKNAVSLYNWWCCILCITTDFKLFKDSFCAIILNN